MRALLFGLSASFGINSLGLAAPLSFDVTRSYETFVDVEDEGAMDRFDNSHYIPTPTENPSDVLQQDKPIPSLYLMSLERADEDDEDDEDNKASRRSQGSQWWFQGAWQALRQEETTANNIPVYDDPDMVVIAMLMGFLLLITFVEMRHRAAVASCEAKHKIGLVVGQIKLEGSEKRLLAETQKMSNDSGG